MYKTKEYKAITISFIISILVAILFSYFYYKEITILSLINGLFMVGLLLFILSGAFYILRSGFFDTMTYSFRRFYKLFSKTGQQLGNDLDQMALPSQLNYPMLKPLFLSSIMTLLLMLILLTIFYLSA
ncbi:DUF3899 domain-containing protein [Bacillus salitolerans]|uniref:DUF3899 domain-containing protein n=1 Tax=Bacillus salitolerans TaxID=1437434 RepID=A0ABW4LLL6_9BACI